METVELLALCDKHPILQELTKRYWEAWLDKQPTGISDFDEFSAGQADAFKTSIDLVLRLVIGAGNAALLDQILELFKPL